MLLTIGSTSAQLATLLTSMVHQASVPDILLQSQFTLMLYCLNTDISGEQS